MLTTFKADVKSREDCRWRQIPWIQDFTDEPADLGGTDKGMNPVGGCIVRAWRVPDNLRRRLQKNAASTWKISMWKWREISILTDFSTLPMYVTGFRIRFTMHFKTKSGQGSG